MIESDSRTQEQEKVMVLVRVLSWLEAIPLEELYASVIREPKRFLLKDDQVMSRTFVDV
jgi:hypothetical protein